MQFFKKLSLQLLLFTPLFWFVEILQNLGYKLIIGDYGWHFPTGQFHWFSFQTLPSWAMALAIMAISYEYICKPKNLASWKYYLLAGTICWAAEWINGYLHAEILQQPLYVWAYSPLKYVGIEAIVLWWSDVWLYDYLRKKIFL